MIPKPKPSGSIQLEKQTEIDPPKMDKNTSPLLPSQQLAKGIKIGERVKLGLERAENRIKKFSGEIITEPLYERSDNCLFVGIHKATRRTMLMLRAKGANIEKFKFKFDKEWICVARKDLSDNNMTHSYLALELLDIDYQEMFLWMLQQVVNDVGQLMSKGTSFFWDKNKDKHLITAFKRGVKKWWNEVKEQDRPLSIPRQRGLYAELWFLRQHVIPKLGPDRSIQYWAGPNGADHDFQLPACGIEVKAVVVGEEAKIKISNEYQLDPIRNDIHFQNGDVQKMPLFLFCLPLREYDPDDLRAEKIKYKDVESLYDIVDGLRKHLESKSQNALVNFKIKLSKAGYRKRDEEKYKQTSRLTVTENQEIEGEEIYPTFYEVADKNGVPFPRIIRSDILGTGVDLPTSLTRIKYTLALSAIQKFAADERVVVARLGSSSP